MGTELQYAVNLLAPIPKTDNLDAVTALNSWEFFKNRLLKEKAQSAGLEKIQDSMDRLLEQWNGESVRKTMLLHEETFKEQVKELHRLYRVQKMLMDEVRNKDRNIHTFTLPTTKGIRFGLDSREIVNRTGFCSPGTGSDTNNSPFTKWHQTNSRYNFHSKSMKADLSPQERSSSCFGDTLEMPRGFNLERPAEEDITINASAIEDQMSLSFQRSSKVKMVHENSHNPRFYTEGESEIELTLSIGCSSGTKKLKTHQSHPSVELGCSELTSSKIRQVGSSSSIILDQAGECSGPSNSMSTESAAFEWDRPHPPCLFQALSLNRT